LREALEVPPDLARPAAADPLALPGGAKPSVTASAAPSAAAAATSSSTATPGRVTLERDGAQRWLVVQEPPESLWPKLRDYFLRNTMRLTLDDPQARILETEWIERPVDMGSSWVGSILGKLHSTGIRDKFRVRIEPGRTPGTSEVYASQQGMEEVVVEGGGVNVLRTAWQPRPADPEMEADLLQKLMRHLGVSEDQAKTLLAGDSSERAKRVKGTLQLPEDLDSAWRRVGVALDRSGVTIEDRDRSAGIYYVRYQDATARKQGGMFSWLTGGRDAPAGPDKREEGPKDRYQVRLESTANGTRVSVLDVKGEPEKSETGERLMGLIQQQLR
jgi:outer membrane protein assembly factor BamC